MPKPRELTRADVLRAASNLRWTRKGTKWTVLVGDRELPARPLVLEAAGVPPNDPTNSHQAVEILRRLGFETRYCKDQSEIENRVIPQEPEASQESDSLLDLVFAITKTVPDEEWDRVPSDLSKNVDQHLYGEQKRGR